MLSKQSREYKIAEENHKILRSEIEALERRIQFDLHEEFAPFAYLGFVKNS